MAISLEIKVELHAPTLKTPEDRVDARIRQLDDAVPVEARDSWSSLLGSLLGGPWDLVTASSWAYNPTYSLPNWP